MTDFETHMKPCHYCRQPVNVSSYRCPHCDRSLAAAEQQQWEQSDPSTESSEESYDRKESGPGTRISPAVIAVCLLVVAVVVYGVFLRQPEKDNEMPAVFTRPVSKPVASAAKTNKSGKTSFIRIHESSDSAAKDVSASGKAPEESEVEAEKRIRLEKIKRASAHILEDLRLEEARENYTVRLTSGREIKCDSVSESDAQVTVKVGGLTATFDRASVESIEHQSAEAAAKKMEQTVLPLATRVVDQGLVRHGTEWITPAEKAHRMQQNRARKETEQVKIHETETPKTPTAETGPAVPREITDKEQLASLLSLVREKEVIDADFFGGTLHIEDRSGQWPGDDDDPSSIIAIEAQAEQIDIAQLCEFLKLDFDAAGICAADADGGVDMRNPRTLTGEAHITCGEMTIPPIDLSPLLSPRNKQVALSLGLLAEDGIITIESFQLVGTAYNVAGTGTIHIAKAPEHSPINGKFKITLKEAPTLADPQKGGKSMQYILDALAGSGTEIDVTLSGPISDPEVELVADSTIGSIAFQVGK